MKSNILFIVMILIGATSRAQNSFVIEGGAHLVCNGNAIISLTDFDNFKNNGTFVPGIGRFVIISTTVPTTIGVNGGGALNFFKLDLNNSTGVQLAQPIAVNDSLHLIAGNLNLKNNSITFATSGGIEGENGAARIMDDPGNTGQVIVTSNLGQSPNSNPGNLGVEVNSTNVAPGNTTITRFCGVIVYHGSSLGLIRRYYKIEPATNSGLNASAKFYYLNEELNGVDPSVAVLWKSEDNGSTWSLLTPDARNTTSRFLEKNNIDDFSLWTIGTINSVLPVVFSSFNSKCLTSGAYLQWSSEAEINSDFFVVQKSDDGFTWHDLARVEATGNRSGYEFEDQFAGPGFYRLKEVDKDGQFTYSKTVRSDCEVKNISVLLYPNPASQFTNLVFKSSTEFNAPISVWDANGRLVRKSQVHVQRGGNVIRINLFGLSNGSYIVALTGYDVNIKKQVVVK